jgi:pyocin large subunit-like protein
MSFQAMAWAVKQPLISTCEKFLLVMLANYADGEGVVYPSVERLSEDLCQDRRTVMKNIRRLIDIGLLEDTGRKIGSTNYIYVYRMIGVPESCILYLNFLV